MFITIITIILTIPTPIITTIMDVMDIIRTIHTIHIVQNIQIQIPAQIQPQMLHTTHKQHTSPFHHHRPTTLNRDDGKATKPHLESGNYAWDGSA
jgi:hypothetical protein